jgi:hypothetical protein
METEARASPSYSDWSTQLVARRAGDIIHLSLDVIAKQYNIDWEGSAQVYIRQGD